LWNDLDEAEKKRYNDNYAADKARYSQELQAYLQATGLKASDLAKPRNRKSRPTATKPSATMTKPAGQDEHTAGSVTGALPHFSQVWAGGSAPASLQTLSGSGGGQTVLAGVGGATAVGQNLTLSDGGQMLAFSSNELKPEHLTTTANSVWTAAGTEAELQNLRDAVSNVTQEAEQLKRQLDEAVAYIRQLEQQQQSVLGDLAVNGTALYTTS
jgi:peptidoglycan hydrolase CwlO-like protein